MTKCDVAQTQMSTHQVILRPLNKSQIAVENHETISNFCLLVAEIMRISKKTFVRTVFRKCRYIFRILYCIFILCAISPCTSGLKALLGPSQLHKYSPSPEITVIPLTERQSLKDDHLSMSLRFFNLPLG